jgi:hypothetical protein
MVKRRKTWSKHADELMQSAMVACWPLNLLFTPVHFLLMMANGFELALPATETDASLYWTRCFFHLLQGILLMQGSPNARRPDSAFWSRIWSALWWMWLLLSLYPAGCMLAGLLPKTLPHKRGPAVMAGGVWQKWQWKNAHLMSARERDATREEPVRRSDFRIPEHALLYLGQRGVAPGVLDLSAPHFPTFENGKLDIKGLGLKAVAADAFRPKTAEGTRMQDSLVDIWLSFNELSELPKNVFAGLPRLPVRERKG